MYSSKCCESSPICNLGFEVLRGIRIESVVAAANVARRGRFGHWFSMEDVVAGHRAMNRGKGIGIVTVAGFTERVIAGAW